MMVIGHELLAMSNRVHAGVQLKHLMGGSQRVKPQQAPPTGDRPAD